MVAVTAMAHTTAVSSRHPSGQRLYEAADIVSRSGHSCAIAPGPCCPAGGTRTEHGVLAGGNGCPRAT